MNSDANEEKLRQYFNKLRLQDASIAPDFERMIRFPPGRPSASMARSVWAAAALAALGLGIVFFQIRTHKPPDELRQWTAFSNWRASTDALLTMSGASLESTFQTATDTFFENNWQQTVLNLNHGKEIL